MAEVPNRCHPVARSNGFETQADEHRFGVRDMTRSKKIFLSHRASDDEDRASANKIKEIFERLGPRAVEVFVSGKSIDAGQEWRKRVVAELRESQYLVFLYTDLHANWNWCHFEAGRFLSFMSTNDGADGADKRIVVLRPDGLPVPSTLDDYMSIEVPTDIERLEQFLDSLFIENDPVRRLWLKTQQNALREMAQEIAEEVVRMACSTTSLVPWLVLRGKENPDADATKLGNYTVRMEKEAQQEVFNYAGVPVDGRDLMWRDIVSEDIAAQPWVAQLATSLSEFIGNKHPTQIDSYYEAPNGGVYRPMLRQIDRSGVGYSAELLFLRYGDELRTDPVQSFSELMLRLTRLIRETQKGDYIKFLAFTPALGFLAEHEPLWNDLRVAMEEKAGQIDLICLNEPTLKKWHSLFIGKPTNRDPDIIDADLVARADEASEQLVRTIQKARRDPRRKSFDQMPGFYCFKNRQRAIVVAPLGVPLLDKNNEALPGWSTLVDRDVQMVGLDTKAANILDNVDSTFMRFW
jgi:hypothetical protein